MKDDEQSNHMPRTQGGYAQRPCRACGEMFIEQGLDCKKCLNERYLAEARQKATLFFSDHPVAPIDTGHDRNRKIHLVLPGFQLAFCGKLITERKQTWRRTGYGESFPIATCSRCLELYPEIAGRPATRREGAEVMK